MDDELPSFIQTPIQHPVQTLGLSNSEDDIAAYQQSASVQDLINPRRTEILNQPSAKRYEYMKPKRRF
jgi:hypothetical protein